MLDFFLATFFCCYEIVPIQIQFQIWQCESYYTVQYKVSTKKKRKTQFFYSQHNNIVNTGGLCQSQMTSSLFSVWIPHECSVSLTLHTFSHYIAVMAFKQTSPWSSSPETTAPTSLSVSQCLCGYLYTLRLPALFVFELNDWFMLIDNIKSYTMGLYN